MLTKLAGGRLYDPANGVAGEVRDLYIRDGRIVDAPPSGASIDVTYDLTGKLVMAGAIDLHTHIGGGKVNIARTMLPELQTRAHAPAHTTDPLRGRTSRTVQLRNGLRLCADGLYKLLRARGAPRERPPGAYGDGGYATGRHWRLRHAR